MGAVRSGTGSPANGHAPRGPGADDQAQYRVLIYSHDSFGLGHLRRCRTIAHSLVAHHKKLNVLILSGSPILGRFSFRSRVDFVRVPGIIKRRNGEYTSLNLDFHVEQTLALRASIIEHTARVFRPDLFLVDKEPLGLLGEVRSTLAHLRRQGGTRLVLGLRDIMDDPTSLAEEWRRKRVIPALKRFYDQIWVYGLSQVYDPVEAYGFPPDVAAKTTFTGYLPRETNPEVALPADVQAAVQQGPFLLVTPGGGGDGARLIDATLTAYERFNGRLPWPAVVVYGPFLPAGDRAAFERRAARLARVTTLEFHEHLENLDREGGRRRVPRGVQHLLRGPVPQEAEPDGAAREAPRGATPPGPGRHGARAGPDARPQPAHAGNARGGADPLARAAAAGHPPGAGPLGRAPLHQPGRREVAGRRTAPSRDPRPGARRPARPQPASRLIPPPAAARMRPSTAPPLVAVVVKGYPRVSETFIAHELAALERRGLSLHIVSLRRPYDALTHPVHATIRAAVTYLPEYLHEAPGRVLRGHVQAFARAPRRYLRALGCWLADVVRDPTPNRGRRFGQAGVLAAELPPAAAHIHAHFLHTPASVARYAAIMTGLGMSLSGHAKDVWTTPDWELRAKLGDARFTVTCTEAGRARLDALRPGRVELVYHGLDRRLFTAPPSVGSPRDGSDPTDPVRLLAVGRFQPKKGYWTLLEAVARVRPAVRLTVVGYGPLDAALRARAQALGLADRVRLGGRARPARGPGALPDQ